MIEVVCFFLNVLSTPLDIRDVHIMFGVENSIALPTTVTMASVLNSTTNREKIHFHFVGETFNKTNLDRILFLKEKFREFTFEWTPFDLSKLNEFQTRSHSKKVMLVLFASEIFPNVNRILYLDYDILILNNIGNLFEMNMEGKYVAGVKMCHREKVCWGSKICESWNISFSFNGGFLLFNLDLVRKNNLQKEFLKHAGGKNKCFGSRQECGIYLSVKESESIMLPGKYNHIFVAKECRAKEYRFNISDTVTLHFADHDKKPWNNEPNVLYKFWKIYQDFYGLLKPFEERVSESKKSGPKQM